MKKISTFESKPLDRWGRAAIAGCDWFVNSQVLEKRPNWDANHGRFMYNVHVPTLRTTWGLGWTQARATMCLIAAYRRTGERKYLESARLGLSYAASLQDMDSRFPLTFGAFHEETPHSPFSYPRDAIEVADAFMQWYAATGNEDALYRAELFFKWFRRNAWKRYPGFGWWVRGSVRFDDEKIDDRPIPCEMGCATILAHAFRITRKSVYRRMSLAIADSALRNYIKPDGGPFRQEIPRKSDQHVDASGVIYNDDGGGVGLLNAYLLGGGKKYLQAAVRMAEYFAGLDRAIPIYSGIGSVANFLIETWKVTGNETFRRASEKLAGNLLDLQIRSGKPLVKGAFRGEDEGGQWYVKGSRNSDFVTTRVTAYAVLTLFKLEGVVWPAGYSTEF